MFFPIYYIMVYFPYYKLKWHKFKYFPHQVLITFRKIGKKSLLLKELYSITHNSLNTETMQESNKDGLWYVNAMGHY